MFRPRPRSFAFAIITALVPEEYHSMASNGWETVGKKKSGAKGGSKIPKKRQTMDSPADHLETGGMVSSHV